MAVQNKLTFKRKGNSWNKKGKAKDAIPKPNQAPKARPTASAECFHYKELGHWKRNCKLYLASLKIKGSKGTSTSRTLHVYVIDRRIIKTYNKQSIHNGCKSHKHSILRDHTTIVFTRK